MEDFKIQFFPPSTSNEPIKNSEKQEALNECNQEPINQRTGTKSSFTL